ncbi:MAG: hypothetical protein Q4F65_06805 [Propionibacteriaceae bacterium]|nr:hypothetical protein [Propionibacteriaceae bacterium]
MPTTHAFRGWRLAGPLAATALLLAACAPTTPGSPAAAPPSSAATAAPTSAVGGNSREVASLNPRVLYSHAGGLVLLDAVTGKTVSTEERAAFLRLSDAGDGRHVVVTDGDRFGVYDTGIQERPHGDHSHYYEYDAGLTPQEFPAPKAGHVVAHEGRTTLWADGTGEFTWFPSDRVADPGPLAKSMSAPDAHHGVALVLADDSILHTVGTTESRNTIRVVKDGTTLAETDQCPGIHGEATAKPTASGDVVLVGCTDGPVVFRDGAFHKVAAPTPYGRTGNSAGSPVSPIVLTDYKSEKDADFERPTRVALVDTLTDSLRLVELGSSYWFRSLARGPHGEALVLTYDGAIKVIDPTSGEVTDSIPTIEPWTEHEQWQHPGPSIKVAGHHAYVTDAANHTLVVVDLSAKKIERTIDLDHAPVEIAVTTGLALEEQSHEAAEHDEHAGHDHDDHQDAHDHD